MEQYRQMTDIELATLAQQGDEDAFTTLFLRYEHALEVAASKASIRFPSYYQDEFLGYFQDRFIKLVHAFDVNSGVYFAHYCKYKFPKMTHDFIRGKLEKRIRDENGKRIKVDEPSLQDTHKVIPSDMSKSDATDARYTYEYQQAINDTVLFVHLGAQDPLFTKVATLIADGYDYVEIATLLGKDGSTNSKKLWVQRIVNRMRKETIRFYQNTGCADELKAFVG